MGPGLCGVCRHARIVKSGKGSRFYLCRRSLSDLSFPRYPPLPVLRCPGFQAGESEGNEPGNLQGGEA